MNWFYKLKNKIRVIIAVCAWIPFVGFLIAMSYITPEGETMPTWATPIVIVLLVVSIVFTIFAVLAYKKEHPKAEKPAARSVTNADVSNLNILQDFHSKVVGVTYNNDDGSSRQKIISKCKAGDDIIFRPVEIPGHPGAIGVFTTDGKQLGHVSSDLAEELRKKYPMNPMSVTISEITGGRDGKNYGCNLHILIYKS